MANFDGVRAFLGQRAPRVQAADRVLPRPRPDLVTLTVHEHIFNGFLVSDERGRDFHVPQSAIGAFRSPFGRDYGFTPDGWQAALATFLWARMRPAAFTPATIEAESRPSDMAPIEIVLSAGAALPKAIALPAPGHAVPPALI